MKRYIKTAKGKYLIRGPWTARELKAQYKALLEKYPNTKLTFDEWLNYGKVYFKVNDGNPN